MKTYKHGEIRRPLPPGPWNDEPDKATWVDEATDLDCMIHRGPLGALCGYVGVTEGHPAFKADYDKVDVEVHGGLTYADFCQETDDESFGICHVPEPGRPHEVWWLGFDCGHFRDAIPGMPTTWAPPLDDGHYWTFDEVKAEVESLALQLVAL